MNNPRARQIGLLTRLVGESLVIYDQEQRRLHTLNQTAALVWRQCDGHGTLTEITARVGGELGTTVDKRLVRLTLERLHEANLLMEQGAPSPASAGASRRTVLRAAAGALLPTILSFGGPTGAHAQDPPPTTLVPTTTLPPTTLVPTNLAPTTSTDPVTRLPSTGAGQMAQDRSDDVSRLAVLLGATAVLGRALKRRVARD